MIAAYQGVDGAYSQLAVHHFLREKGVDEATLGLPSYREVAASVAASRADIGIVPIENAIAGTVREGYELVAEFGLAPVAEVLWRTDHRLLGVPGATLADVREILAHPLTIAECSRFLSSLSGARPIPCEDTGVAAREVARSGNPAIAALASPTAARIYDLVELASNCGDHPKTFSRFLVVRGPLAPPWPPSQARKTSIVFSLADTPGKLATCLNEFASRGVNLSKVESKARLGHGTEHVFYVDLDGDVADPRVAEALAKIDAEAVVLTVLGSYDAHTGAPIGANDVAVRRAERVSGDTWHPQPLAGSSASALPRVSRPARPGGSTLAVGGVVIGDGTFTIVAGPCSVESREQILETAQAVHARGAVMLRGGAFKPRTSPYAFQGLGWEGVDLLAEAGRATGMPTVSEVMTIDQVDRMARLIDVLQIGARNMQNFDLLKAVGRTGKPVLLKRGLSATLDELLAAAEYILAEGNPNVILCERGIRTFENATRNTLDLSAVPVLRERSHLPVLVDPSHGVGVRRWIRPLCRAAKAVGAHGILVEVHPNPPEAKSDKEQALTFDDFAQIVADLDRLPVETAAMTPA
ncbi:MAG TPA: 3-deoxy-7-phosphoheptulonate synthase [Candidatus Baltobacteraceae bacterium]|jgi:chorismate mutase/prephenate dehydratase|nr:3-deoxy-7-phosphoheptulonate synthase [Candidatus Baltobacteraceae bacterium]